MNALVAPEERNVRSAAPAANSCLVVEKIGGTSMSRFEEVMKNIILNRAAYRASLPAYPYGRVFVVSAYGGITDLLLENKKTGAPGIYHKFLVQRGYRAALEELLEKLKTLNKGLAPLGLDLKAANEFITKRIHKTSALLKDLANVFASGYVLRENILLATKEILASIGEVHSAFNSALITKAHGIATCFIDLSGFEDNHPFSIEERIKQAIKNLSPFTQVPFVTGYVKGVEGIMRKFDRGYSEVTFSRLAVLMGAKEAIIHKEYHLSSADPKIVGEKNAIPIGQTNYDVADQLADVGMEAIHPRASKPLEKNNINLRVKNTFDTAHQGTLISKHYRGAKARVEVITGSTKVSLLEVHDPEMVGEAGFDHRVCGIFTDNRISYICKATNANTISTLIWQSDATPNFLKALQQVFPNVKRFEAVAVVCVIGSNIRVPGVLSECARALAAAEVNVKCLSQSNRQVNMQFVIERRDYEKAIKALHSRLILKADPLRRNP